MQKVQVCTGKACQERFSKYIATRLENDKKHFDWEIEVECCSCMNHCEKWPNIKVKNQVYHHVSPAKASEIVQKNAIASKKETSWDTSSNSKK